MRPMERRIARGRYVLIRRRPGIRAAAASMRLRISPVYSDRIIKFCKGRHRAMRRLAFLFPVTACLWLASSVFGQGTTATILGTVSDTSGAVLPEAVVEVRNVGTGAAQSVTSDSQGRFRIADLG